MVAANAKEWSAFQVQEWAVEIMLPDPVVKALHGLSGRQLAAMAVDLTLLKDLELKALQVLRLQDELAELAFH